MKSSIYNSLAKRSAKSKRRRPKLFMETLGDRTLLAAAITASLNTADGILRVEGTYEADTIRVRYAVGNVRVDEATIAVTDGGTTTSVSAVPRAQVTKVVVAALDGDDLVQMHDALGSRNVTLPMVIHGQAGNDTLVGGAGADTIFGESGIDSILGGGGADMMYGDADPAAAQLVRDHGLYIIDESMYTNWIGQGEKWVLGRYNHDLVFNEHYITPAGEVYEYKVWTFVNDDWTVTITDRKIATLDPSYFHDLRKLESELGLYPYWMYYGSGNRDEKWLLGQTTRLATGSTSLRGLASWWRTRTTITTGRSSRRPDRSSAPSTFPTWPTRAS